MRVITTLFTVASFSVFVAGVLSGQFGVILFGLVLLVSAVILDFGAFWGTSTRRSNARSARLSTPDEKRRDQDRAA